LFRRVAGVRPVARGEGSVDHLYVVRVHNRERVRKQLGERGIMTAVHYAIPLHRQPAFRSRDKLPHAETACREIVSLPLWPYLDESSVRQVVQACQEVLAREVTP
jgi:UDP-2-acetamido-2-deoxy-ribo-hexuluronate aminotransferase